LSAPTGGRGFSGNSRYAARTGGFSLVAMHNKGFAPLQKPAGRYFDACAEGRLLMLAPDAWPYTPAEKPMTRDDAAAMNRLCQFLAGEGAAKIAYRGVTPAGVDSLALGAVNARRARSLSAAAQECPKEGERAQ